MMPPKVLTPIQATPIPEDDFRQATPAELLSLGKTLQRAGTPFVTAMSVQKPRSLDRIREAIGREAELAGEEFYYSWKQGGELVEGPSIGLANSLFREWGNCAQTVELQENDVAFYITPRFIDLQTGSQSERVFRQRKSQVAGKYDPDRKLDMALQIGQSKAIRNVVVNAVPRWLVSEAVQKAKDAVVKGLDPSKLDEYRNIIISEFAKLKVSKDQLIEKVGRPVSEWGTRDIANFKGDLRAIRGGEAAATELFPPADAKAPAGPVTPDAAAGATIKTTPAAPASSAPSPDEQKRIQEREIAEANGGKSPTSAKPGAKKDDGHLFG